MQRVASLSLLFCVLILFSCERALEIDEPKTLLSVEVEDFLLEGERGYYYVNAADGALLAGDEFSNQSEIEVTLPYQGTDLSFTYITSNSNISRAKAYSYLDLPVGASFTLSRTARSSSNSANILFYEFSC